MRKLRLGKVEVYFFQEGKFWLDGGAMFGVVPKVLWSKLIESDELNRIPMGANLLLVKTGRNLVLVDTGIGESWDEKMKEIYSIERKDWFDEVGYGPSDITHVVLTHLHFDHTGGSTEKVDGRFVPVFKKATYIVQSDEWYVATNKNERTRAAYIDERFRPLEGQLEFVNGDVQIVEGVRVVKTGGHTRGHQVVIVEGGGKSLLYMADLVPMATHVRLPYIMAYDNYPLETLEKKKELYKWAIEEDVLIVFEHDFEPTMGYLEFNGKQYSLKKI